MKRILYFASVLFLPGMVMAQPQLVEKYEAPPKSPNISYEKWHLPNGLTIILHEDHSDPIVHVQVGYHVGSDREKIGRSGFAHFFEHMMFQGSSHVKDEEHFKLISGAGGDLNGYTTSDKTVYYETLPSNYLETALWLESDRMGFLLDSVTQRKFEVQRATVKNEKGQNVENQPYVLGAVELLPRALYPEGHPYNWPTIGYVDDLNKATVQDLKDFFLRWYGPNNAVLTIAGDINPAEALKLSEKYFGNIVKCPEVKKLRVEPPVLGTDKYTSYVDNVYLPLTLMTFPTVPQYHKDEAPLELLARMMGDGNNSLFYKNFVKADKAIEASVGYDGKELAGEFTVQVVAYPVEDATKGFNDIEKKIRETIIQFGNEGITEESLERQKAKYETNFVNYKESVASKARMLNEWEMIVGRSFNISDEIDRYKKVTKEDIVRVFNKYIKDKHAAILSVYPANPFQEKKDSIKSVNPYANYKPAPDPQYQGLKYVKAVDNFDRAVHPTPGPAKMVSVPKYYSANINGAKLVGTQNSELPKVTVLIEMDGGDLLNEKPEKIGLANLTAQMMNEGTKKFTTEQVSAQLERLGSDITFSATKQKTQIVVEALTKNLDATLAILEEKLLNPRFDEEDFYRVRKQTVEGLNQRKSSAQSMAGEAFANIVYGNTVMGSYATAKSIKKLSLGDVKDYYNKYYTPTIASIVVVGDVSQNDILPKLEFLKKWQAKPVKAPTFANFPAVEKPQIYLVNKNEAPQSVISIGNVSLPYDATGDYFKANVMNYSLGGAFNSRINLNLREDKGFTYGARSFFRESKYPGYFMVNTSVRKTATDSAVTEIMKEIKGYVENGIKDDELSFTKSSLLSSDALKYETSSDKAQFLSKIVEYNLTGDYISKQADILKSISKGDINNMAKKYLDPSKMVIIVVGDKTKIKKSLENLGYGKVKDAFVD